MILMVVFGHFGSGADGPLVASMYALVLLGLKGFEDALSAPCLAVPNARLWLARACIKLVLSRFGSGA